MVTEPVDDPTATRAEDARDLRRQVAGLEQQDQGEIIFRETSPERRKVTVYNMANGEPVQIPAYMVDAVLRKLQENGEPMFTARKERAPEYRLGTTLCFLHEESAERTVLQDIGLTGTTCRKKTLANAHAKRMHALHRHPEEWAAYQEHVEEQKERVAIERQERQLEATLALARGAVSPQEDARQEDARGVCDECGRSGFKNVSSHKRGAHPR